MQFQIFPRFVLGRQLYLVTGEVLYLCYLLSTILIKALFYRMFHEIIYCLFCLLQNLLPCNTHSGSPRLIHFHIDILWMSNILVLSVSDSGYFSNNNILCCFKEWIFVLAKPPSLGKRGNGNKSPVPRNKGQDKRKQPQAAPGEV